MNITRGLLAAVGAFWSEVIPPYVPADYEDHTAHLDPDFEVPGSLLCHFCDLPSGHDGPHKDCMCGKCQPFPAVLEDVTLARQALMDEAGPDRMCHYCFGPRSECTHVYREAFVATSLEPPVVPVAVDDCPPVSPATGLNFVDYMTPAICDVLAEHHMFHEGGSQYTCCAPGERPHIRVWDQQEWREHVAPLIAERIERSQNSRK